ncbi:hypothetical protein DPMN_001096 [Dreissena polymorpha]|uniref:Uncharacterized protein n=1 Tax=Dreissena polymorpha TaxID=45954 RepID=A0A9D4MJM4_DREPO|nr:hypothetical protein DPMN_001096 [Dreissena polymorpha]
MFSFEGTSAGGSANPASRHLRAGRTLFCWDCCLPQDAAVSSTAVYRRELTGPDLPEVPSEEGLEQWDSGITRVGETRGGPGL